MPAVGFMPISSSVGSLRQRDRQFPAFEITIEPVRRNGGRPDRACEPDPK